MSANYSHQTDIFDPTAFTWPVHLIGLGGIGSAVALPLVKLGLRSELHLWDNDAVESHNIPAQVIYSVADVGKAKVEAAAEFLDRFREPDCTIIAHRDVVTAQTPLAGVVISGVDSMASRLAIWEGLEFNPEVPLYMDGRIGGEQLQLFTLNPCDPEGVDFYKKWLFFTDDEAAPLPCAARTVIHPPILLAGFVIAQLTRFARELPTVRYLDVHARDSQLSKW